MTQKWGFKKNFRLFKIHCLEHTLAEQNSTNLLCQDLFKTHYFQNYYKKEKDDTFNA